jgi:opacity protein-like surface antigen
MKKGIILSLALLLGIGAAAQIKFGIKAGLNLSSLSDIKAEVSGISVKVFDNDGMAVGFHAGGFVNFSFGQYVGLQSELLFSMQGGQQKLSSFLASRLIPFGLPANLRYSYTFDYINIPVLLDIKPFANFSILIGPQIGFNIYKSATESAGGVSDTISGSDFDDTFGDNSFKSVDFAVVGGLQYTFIDHLTIGARYNWGLTGALSTSVTQSGVTVDMTGWQNGVIQVSVGWTF